MKLSIYLAMALSLCLHFVGVLSAMVAAPASAVTRDIARADWKMYVQELSMIMQLANI